MVTEGGEEQFLSQMIEESLEFKNQIKLFTTLVGKKKSLVPLKTQIENLKSNISKQNKNSSEVKVFETTFYQGKTLRYSKNI